MARETVQIWWWWARGRSAAGPRCFATEAGVDSVVVLERETAGSGASSRAAGMVRAQGGSPDTVRLGTWSIDFYRSPTGAVRHRQRVPGSGLRDPRGDRGRRAGGARADRDAAVGRAGRALGGRRRGPCLDPGDGRGGLPRGPTSRPTGGSTRHGTSERTRRPWSGPVCGCVSTPPSSAFGRGRAPRPPHRHRGRDHVRDDRDRPGRPDGGTGPPVRRRWPPGPGCGWGTRGTRWSVTAPSDGLHGDRTAMAFDLRRRHLLASRGTRAPMGHVEPGRDPRRRARDRLDVPAADATASPPSDAGDRRPRDQAGLGGHDRVHARSPADRRPARRPRRTGRSRVRRSRGSAGTG